MTPHPDTIAAVATAPGRGAIGVVRVSGTDLGDMAVALTGRALPPRQATVASFRDAAGEVLDQGVALYFQAPHSYTGEDVLELQGHGGTVVLRRVLERCMALGARLAEPGEFTRRAFVNGKLDLVQAEAVIDLIDAATAQAARSAARSLQGAFSAAVQEVNRRVIDARALLEAHLDFPEEELGALDTAPTHAQIRGAQEALQQLVEAARQGSLMREGLQVAIAGLPNVGKSSLLNCLAGQELAIVTDIPGTTRDAVRETFDLEGIPVQFIDTAGLRETDDPVERIGVERAWRAIESADVLLHLVDIRTGIQEADAALLARFPPALPRVTAFNKSDLLRHDSPDRPGEVEISARTGAGIDALKRAVLKEAGWHAAEGIYLARARHLWALEDAQRELSSALAAGAPELLAEHLRLAQVALSSIVGNFTADDLLGEIFQRFCIGK